MSGISSTLPARTEQTTYLGCTITVYPDGYAALTQSGRAGWFRSMAMLRLWARQMRRAT